MNLPNKLTVSRLVMIPLFVLFFYLTVVPGNYAIALAVFVIASLTDLLDGKIARKYNLVTNLGKFLDPIADKVLVSSALIVLLTVPEIFTVYLGEWNIILAGICVAVILARELIVSGFRMVAASAGLVLAADKIGKYKTVFQDAAIIVLLLSAQLLYQAAGEVLFYVGEVCLLAATVLTIVSGINYIVKNRAVLKA